MHCMPGPYVGRMTRRLRDCLHDHLYDIEKNHSTNVARHWVQHHKKNVPSHVIQGMEKITMPTRGGDKFGILCRKEAFRIFTLHTRKAVGLHFDWGVSYFYE